MNTKTKNADIYNWNFSVLTKDDFLKVRKEMSNEHDNFISKWQKRTDWLKNQKILKTALCEYEYLKRYYVNGSEESYYWLRSQIEEGNTEVKARFNQINDFNISLKNKLNFFEFRLSRLPKNVRQKFIADKNLKIYKHFLEKLFAQSNYLLSEPEENIIQLKVQSSHSNWVKMTSSILSAERVKITSIAGVNSGKSFSEILSSINSNDKKVRDNSARALNVILRNNLKIGEHEINSILANKKVDDELRHMDRPDLSRHLNDDINTSAVDTMIKVVSDNFSLAQKYYELKAKLLKTKQLKYHERNVPIGKLEVKYNFKKSKRLLQEVLAELDSEFLDIFNSFDRNGNIDVYSRRGKRSGAFCIAASITQPTFIMLNHNNKFQDVLTLAHEVGHGINNEMMRSRQNSLNFGTTLATAEVASTFFESCVVESILKVVDEKKRLSMMMERLNQDITAVFRQVALYLFEQELHQEFRAKGYLSSNEIGRLFQKHMSAYMGPAVEQSEGSENWWVHWGHIRSFFYAYSYASGLLISKYLQNQVAKDKKFIKDVKYFLSTGLSESPREIFNNLGIDINSEIFWKKGVKEIANLLLETEKLAKKLKV